MAQRPVVIVSNRGPLSFSVGEGGDLVARRGAAQDHPALLSLPESLYLKCLIIQAD